MGEKIQLNAFSGTGKTSSKQQEEIDRLRSTHDTWKAYSPLWSFYLSAYEGGEIFANSGNLFKHLRENQEDFKDRAKRLHNMNYCEPLVDFFTNFIFSESIDRSGGGNDPWYREFIRDVNRKGDSVDGFMRGVCDDMQIFGMSYILVDSPPKPLGVVLSTAQEKQSKIRPYWVLVKPEEITDWVTDEFGKYLYTKRKESLIRMEGRKPRKIEKYTEFFPDLYYITEVDISNPDKPKIVRQEELPNELGQIPLVVARYKRSKTDSYLGLSFLRDFAYNQREIMNLTSLLQEFLYRQAFNVLTKERDDAIPSAEQEEGLIGPSNVVEYPRGANAPQYLSPPADPAKFIQEERARIKNEMFVRAAQDALIELFNGEKASGFSQAQSFSKTVPFIASRADVLERTEISLMELTAAMSNKTWNGKINYKDDYSITNLTDGITQFLSLVKDLQLPSETFVKEELKRMVHEFDGKLEDEKLNAVLKEIDDMDFKSWAKTQKEALVGKQGTSPSDQQKPKSTGTMMEAAQEAKSVNNGATKKLRKAA